MAVRHRALYATLAEQSARSGVWNCPTLYVYAVLSNFSQPIIDNRRAFVRELHAHGARLLAGTDAGYLLPAGSSLIDELHEFVASGLTPFEALAAATRDAAVARRRLRHHRGRLTRRSSPAGRRSAAGHRGVAPSGDGDRPWRSAAAGHAQARRGAMTEAHLRDATQRFTLIIF